MMTQEDAIVSTQPPHTTRKNKVWSWVLVIFLVIIIIGAYQVREYSKILVATPPAVLSSKADCAVILTGAAGRVREGITLLSHNQVKRLIISGVHQSSTLSGMFPEILFYPEIDLESVILERRSSSTASNAQQSLAIVEALRCQSVLLVTSDYHMHRALKAFGQTYPPSLQIIPYPVPSDRLRKRTSLWIDTRFWTIVFDEWLKYLFYLAFVYE